MPRTKKKIIELTPQGLAKAINKRFGEGTIGFASDPALQIERIPTGILSLDDATGGGFPRGRHTEIFGSADTAKTYSALRFIANAQQMGLNCVFIDVEHTFDPAMAEHAGVDLDNLAFPKRGQNANRFVDISETFLRSEIYDVVVFDSIAALVPKAEEESTMQDGSYGTEQAKLMSKALRKLTAANERACIVWINQVRDNIGVTFGKRTRTSGGRAMGFYAGLRIEMSRTENITKKSKIIDPATGNEKDSNVITGHRVLIRIEKNKVGGPNTYTQGSFVFDYNNRCIDEIEDLIYLGRKYGFVHKSGDSWYVDTWEDYKQHGRPKFKKWLKKNVAVAGELRGWIQESFDEEEE